MPNAYDETEHQIITNGLGLRVKEVEQKSRSKKGVTAMDPCRSTSSMEKQVCEESAVVEEKENRSGASRMEDKQSLHAFIFDGTDDIHELEWKKEEADRETEELVDQIEQCELTIDDLRQQISGLQAREMKLIQCNEKINEDLADQIKDLRERLRESKLRERELQAQLERSRQVKEDLRMELEETKVRAIQLRQSKVRERESDSIQHTRREQGQLSHELLQQLVEVTVENISQRNAPAANTQQVIYQRHPHDVDIIAEQNQAISYLKQENSHAGRKARRANLEAEYFRNELLKSSKKKQPRGEKVIALSRQGGITQVLLFLAIKCLKLIIE
ncbi:hypothetical protein ZTR_08249 [Talaromyces verruculosus]|nr:hypothetical protein ZTR_08249 [Talaromyces verruculosus]